MTEQYFTARLLRGVNMKDRVKYLARTHTGGYRLKGIGDATRGGPDHDLVNDTIKALIEKNKLLPGLGGGGCDEAVVVTVPLKAACALLAFVETGTLNWLRSIWKLERWHGSRLYTHKVRSSRRYARASSWLAGG